MLVAAGMLCISLGGCGGAPSIPVIDKSPDRVIPPTDVVQDQDSIYTIAWRYGLDYKNIAKWNGLTKPYKLTRGQVLRLQGGRQIPPANNSTQRPPNKSPNKSPNKAPNNPANKPNKPSQQPSRAKPNRTGNTAAAKPPAAGDWNWPAKGKVIDKFSSGGANGIKIAGAGGSPIRATAAGEVVYAGEGLRGYGKLIIVKHSPDYLSAYAHNRAIMVAEGDRVNSGQQIARMGASGADRIMLHFEIRKNGKPVDPLRFLNSNS